jgi:glycosyltransferase involved in cell wall biosynthesis
MRILVLTPTFLPAVGGAELVILQIYRRLALKHKILILTPHLSEKITRNSGSSEYDDLVNFKVKRYHDKFTLMKIRGHRITLGLIPPFSLSAVLALKRAINIFKPDVINVHYVMPTGLAGIYAQKILKIPTVITYNGRDVPGPGVPKIWKFWHRFVGTNCQDMTFVSKYCRDVIYGRHSKIGHIVYNGVDESIDIAQEKMDTLRAKLKFHSNEKIIFSLQRLDHMKRVDTIIECMPKVLKFQNNTRLIIGGIGPELPRLKKLVNKLCLDQNVTFAEFIPSSELPIYFALADIFAFHSTYETFGIVLAEAMNYGKAIVSVKNTAIKEVVDNKKNGILVPTFDRNAFAGAVIELLKDDDKRYQMGNEGKNKVNKLFQWDLIASKYETILKAASFENNISD